jgi:hypothetical protein
MMGFIGTECNVAEALEVEFVNIRSLRSNLSSKERLSRALDSELTEAEMGVLNQIMDHQVAHMCHLR